MYHATKFSIEGFCEAVAPFHIGVTLVEPGGARTEFRYVPAVMEMLSGSGIPLIQTDINTELVTPTGMGIIKCLSPGFGSMPQMIKYRPLLNS